MSDASTKTIQLENVTQVFPGRLGTKVVAVNGVSLELKSDNPRIASLVGASGSGKSTIARILLGLQRPTSGSITYQGKDIAKLTRAEYATFRRDVQPVFQDPYAIFNPFYRVDRIFWKAIKNFKLTRGREAGTTKIEESLEAVRLKPGDVLGRYAHQLSGGQRQRLMLARIHMLQPSFVIADEPVSMLDAQVRRHFLDIMIDFQQTFGMTTLFITHDLSTVAYVGGDMMTIYKGQIVERGAVSQVLTKPSHPYTQLLIDSVPTPDPSDRWTTRVELVDGAPRIVPINDADGAVRDNTGQALEAGG
jgi:peptide/nickel transport system ATP-binding protein